jgi:hypothetical protein
MHGWRIARRKRFIQRFIESTIKIGCAVHESSCATRSSMRVAVVKLPASWVATP